MRLGWLVVMGIGALCFPGSALAEVVQLAPGDDVEGAINAAQPGDELVLAGGTYALTERFGISVRGTADAPIVVRAAEAATPVLSRSSADQNVIDVDDAEHLVLRGLEITGGSHGLRLVRARFVTIEACEIHDTGDVALSANSGGPYEALHIARNHIHHTNNTGEGMYLGCNDNGCQVFDSVIEGNYVHHTNGATVEQGDGIELKEGSYNNVVRDNVIHDTKYPCILTYSTAGNGAPNVIERNALWGCGDHAIQSAADAIIRNNIILGSAASGIAMQPHQSGAPDNVVVVHNTILHATNDAIRASDIVGSVVIANNAVYAQAGSGIRVSGELGGLVIAGNVGLGGVEPTSAGALAMGSLAADFAAADFGNDVPNDVFPVAGSALLGAGDAEHVVADDFNGTARGGVPDVGAYRFDTAGNPGWTLAEEPKGDAAPSEPDAGTATDGGAASPDAGRPPTSDAGPSDGGPSSGDASTGGANEDGGCSIAGRTRAPRASAALSALALLGVLRGRLTSRSRRNRAR